MANPSTLVQNRIVRELKDKRDLYQNLTETRREELLEIYRAFITFREEREETWSTSFKVNKAHEIVEKVLPRIIAKNPKWLVSVRDEGAFPEALRGQTEESALFIQDYLTYIWDEYGLIRPARLWAKQMLLYGKGYAKVKYKYEIARVQEETMKPVLDEAGMPMMDEEGNEMEEMSEGVSEKVIGEYPTIDVKSWANIYYDPRFVLLEDRPDFIEETEGVRFSELWKRKKKYFNLDKVRDLGAGTDLSDQDWKMKLFNVTGIMYADNDVPDPLLLHDLKVTVFYGLFNADEDPSESPENEKLYEITMVNDLVVIGFKEITQIPFEEIKCFEDPETAYARGFVEPIIGLQEELNFKKNSASEYINKSLQRQMIWSSRSGIDPSTINDPVIVTNYDGQTAVANFVEMPKPEINASFFQEQNDMERQIQSMSFTVDTSNPRNENALTNTATGIRIKFFESNSVIDEVRKHFEHGLQCLAYKLLMSAFENLEDNIVIKKQGTEGYWKANKEMLRNAITRYSIRVEVASSSYDFIENRREEALAIYNAMLQAKAQGEQVNTAQALRDLLSTFESLDSSKYLQQVPSAGQIIQNAKPLPEESVQTQGQLSPQELTEEVAQGNIFS